MKAAPFQVSVRCLIAVFVIEGIAVRPGNGALSRHRR